MLWGKPSVTWFNQVSQSRWVIVTMTHRDVVIVTMIVTKLGEYEAPGTLEASEETLSPRDLRSTKIFDYLSQAMLDMT